MSDDKLNEMNKPKVSVGWLIFWAFLTVLCAALTIFLVLTIFLLLAQPASDPMVYKLF